MKLPYRTILRHNLFAVVVLIVPAKLKLDALKTMKPTNTKDNVDAIATEAQAIWGDDWFAELVRHCELEGRMTGSKPPAKSRRPHLSEPSRPATQL